MRNFLDKPADPITLGTSPINDRADSLTLFSLWPLNSAPVSHGQS